MKIENRFTNKKYIGAENSYYFDGIDDFIEFPEPISWESASWSISCFSKLISDDGILGNPVPIYSSAIFPSTNLKFRLSYRNDLGTIGIRLFPNNLDSSLVAISTPYINTQWVHTIVQYDFNTKLAYFYVNTKLIATVSITWALTVIGGYSFFIGYSPLNYGNVEIANLSVFDRLLTIDEIGYIHRYVGIIPPTAHGNAILYEPLDAKSFSKKSYFDVSTTSTITSINQISHGFSIGDCIYDNLGTWTIADGTDSLSYSNPPTIVTNVIDANNFEYSQEGIATISNHGFILGNSLYCQSDGTLGYTETDNLIGKVIDFDFIHIASAIRQGVTTSHSQFNYAKASPLEEITGFVNGKTDEELGLPDFSTQNSFIDLYDGTSYQPTTLGLENKSGFPVIRKNLKFNNIDSATKSIVPSITLPNLTDDFSYLVNFSLPAEEIVVANPTYARFLTLKNTIIGYSLEIRYNYITQELEFVTGLNELFMYSIENYKINNTNLSAVVTRENGNIIFYLNGYPIVNTNTPLDLTGCDIIKIGN